MNELISIKSVIKKDEQQNEILKGIDASVYEGELITIIGPSGSGKSTLLTLLNRLVDPDEGIIKLKGTPYSEIDILELRRRVGMVFQFPIMIKGTVKDNLLIGPSFTGKQVSDRELDQLLERVGLSKDLKNKDAKHLSGGQKQRAALARTLANQSEILLLDEVTASLDANSTLEIEQLIRSLHEKDGKTILMVSHQLEQAKRLGNITWVLAEGKIVEQGKSEEVFRNPKHIATKSLLKL